MVSKAAEEADVLAHDGHGLGQRRAWALVFFQSVKCCAIELDLNFLGRFVFFLDIVRRAWMYTKLFRFKPRQTVDRFVSPRLGVTRLEV